MYVCSYFVNKLEDTYLQLKKHLVSNQVQQSEFDRCLLRGLQMVEWKVRELSLLAPVLTILLQSGAKCNSDVLLAMQKTPYHTICESPGDHHELLELLIKSSQRTIIDKPDINIQTALMYAVNSVNINCVKCLIANGADVTIGHETDPSSMFYGMQSWTPITAAICMLSNNSEHSSVIMSDIFDLLLDTVVENHKDHFMSFTGYVKCANFNRNVICMLKLLKKGTPLDIIAYEDEYVWESAASMGNIELLDCMFDRGIDKDTIHNGFTVLWCVVFSRNVEAVRYLLDLGVAIPTFTPEVPDTQCEECKEDILIIDREQIDQNPSMRAINSKKLDMVKLFVEYGS